MLGTKPKPFCSNLNFLHAPPVLSWNLKNRLFLADIDSSFLHYVSSIVWLFWGEHLYTNFFLQSCTFFDTFYFDLAYSLSRHFLDIPSTFSAHRYYFFLTFFAQPLHKHFFLHISSTFFQHRHSWMSLVHFYTYFSFFANPLCKHLSQYLHDIFLLKTRFAHTWKEKYLRLTYLHYEVSMNELHNLGLCKRI